MMVQELNDEKLKVLDEIQLIYKNHDHKNGKSKCSCRMCEELLKLGQKYESINRQIRNKRTGIQESDPRIVEISSRNYFLRKEDLEYMLVEQMLNQKDAAKRIGVSAPYFSRKCKELGMSYHVVQAERRRRHGNVE